MSHPDLRELMAGADRVIYACRVWSERATTPAATQMSCADCDAKVAVTASVLADRRRQAHAVGRSLAVVCDDCAVTQVLESGAIIAYMPSADEISEANP